MLVYIKIKNKIEQCVVKEERENGDIFIVEYKGSELSVNKKDILAVQIENFANFNQ